MVASTKRFPRWLVALMLALASLGGVACEANVDADGEEVEDTEGDTDVDVDTDTEGGEEGAVEDDAVEEEETE